MKDNYCVMNVKGVKGTNGMVWEMCVESDNIIFPTNIFIEANSVCEALVIAKDHIDFHKDLMDQCGSVTLDNKVLISKN